MPHQTGKQVYDLLKAGRVRIFCLALVATIVVTCSSCATRTSDTVVPAAGLDSAKEFVNLAGTAIEVDYDTLPDPRSALSQSEVVVVGTVKAVLPGEKVQLTDPTEAERARLHQFLLLALSVDEIIEGDQKLVLDNVVYVRLQLSPLVSLDALQAAKPDARVVALLNESPSPIRGSGQVLRPLDIPAGAPILAAFTDGLWFQGSADPEMLAIHTTVSSLSRQWQGATTVAAYADALRRAK